jgi:hypothetical protein
MDEETKDSFYPTDCSLFFLLDLFVSASIKCFVVFRLFSALPGFFKSIVYTFQTISLFSVGEKRLIKELSHSSMSSARFIYSRRQLTMHNRNAYTQKRHQEWVRKTGSLEVVSSCCLSYFKTSFYFIYKAIL